MHRNLGVDLKLFVSPPPSPYLNVYQFDKTFNYTVILFSRITKVTPERPRITPDHTRNRDERPAPRGTIPAGKAGFPILRAILVDYR